jgi:hypothetical protein
LRIQGLQPGALTLRRLSERKARPEVQVCPGLEPSVIGGPYSKRRGHLVEDPPPIAVEFGCPAEDRLSELDRRVARTGLGRGGVGHRPPDGDPGPGAALVPQGHAILSTGFAHKDERRSVSVQEGLRPSRIAFFVDGADNDPLPAVRRPDFRHSVDEGRRESLPSTAPRPRGLHLYCAEPAEFAAADRGRPPMM